MRFACAFRARKRARRVSLMAHGKRGNGAGSAPGKGISPRRAAHLLGALAAAASLLGAGVWGSADDLTQVSFFAEDTHVLGELRLGCSTRRQSYLITQPKRTLCALLAALTGPGHTHLASANWPCAASGLHARCIRACFSPFFATAKAVKAIRPDP